MFKWIAHGDLVASHAVLAKLGRYQIMKHLARGGMADVLLARTTGIEGFSRHVVLKRIREEQSRDQMYVSMFLDEARLAASLHHHNIVQVTDIGEARGEYFFTMEYVHGEDVRALLSRVSKHRELLPLEHVLSIVCAAAAGLHHAHEHRGPDRKSLGIVHRDVSPANILIGYDGSVKVADFGIAKMSQRSVETASGTLKGKVAYMSPEQAVGDAVDRRSDVFSLGIVLYELLTVRRLFKGENDFLTMTAIVLGYIPPASELRPDLPPEIEEVLMKALANKPQDRYATADEFRLALEHAAAELQLPMSSNGLADYMKHVFGERPLPWMDDQEPIIDYDVDFDGSKSGVARPPTSDPRDDMAPVETAHGWRAPQRPARQTDVHDLPEFSAELVSVPFDELESSPSVILLVQKPGAKPEAQPALVTPRQETEIPPLRIGRTLLALLALVAIGLSVYVIRRESNWRDDMQAVGLPVETTPLPKMLSSPPLPTGAKIDAVAPAPAPVVAPAPEPKKPKAKAKAAPQAPKPVVQKKWDPNSLFLE